jgi:hypothetical protein
MLFFRLTIEENVSILHLTIILRTPLNTFSNLTDRSYKTILRVYRRSTSSVKDSGRLSRVVKLDESYVNAGVKAVGSRYVRRAVGGNVDNGSKVYGLVHNSERAMMRT